MVVFENYPSDRRARRQRTEALGIRGVAGGVATHYPVTIIAQPGPPLRLRFVYRDDLFDEQTVSGWAAALLQVLAALSADSMQRIAATELVAPAARQQMLEAWNDTTSANPQTSVSALFEAQVTARPHAVAVAAGADQVSYAALDAKASELAARLRGVGAVSYTHLTLPTIYSV